MATLIDAARDIVVNQYRLEGRELDTTVLEAVLIDVNESAERTSALNRVVWKPWDWVSPINGVPAETVRERADVLPGQAYLIYVDGTVAVFQPHLPNSPGLVPLDSEESMRVAAEGQAAELVDNLAIHQIVERATRRLLAVAAQVEQQQRLSDQRAQRTRRT